MELWSCSDTVNSQTLLAATKQRLSSRFVPRLPFHKQFHTCSQMTGSSSKTNFKPGAAAKTPSHVQFIPLRFSRSGFFILFSILVRFFLFHFTLYHKLALVGLCHSSVNPASRWEQGEAQNSATRLRSRYVNCARTPLPRNPVRF